MNICRYKGKSRRTLCKANAETGDRYRGSRNGVIKQFHPKKELEKGLRKS